MAYKIPTTATASKANSSKQILVDLDLSSDESYTGDKSFGTVILNGYTLTVIGNLDITDTFEAKGAGKLLVENDITIGNDCKLEDAGAEIRSYAGRITVSNALIGPGTVTYCVSPVVNSESGEPTIVPNVCGDTLPVESFNFQQIEVSCDLISIIKDGYRYLPIE